MEEIKNENVVGQQVEETVEQRPSTKYGRTAYQQQLQEEQAALNRTEQESENSQSSERPYQQYQNQYNQPQYQQYTPYQEVLPEVKNWPAYVLMALVVISTVISFALNTFLSQAYSMGNSLDEVIDATITLSEQPTAVILTSITDVLVWATIALIVFDIMQLRKSGKKIGGAVAFAILLRPAYFIWRAHLLGQKKVLSVVYAIVVYMITIAQYYVLLSASMEMVMRTML